MTYDEALKIRERIISNGMGCTIFSDVDTSDCFVDVYKNQHRAISGLRPIARIRSKSWASTGLTKKPNLITGEATKAEAAEIVIT